jgi:hypothetical protein
MSVDDRLRQGLGANATAMEPQVETRLDDVRRRGRRAGRVRRARTGALVAAAVAVAALVAFVVRPEVPQDPSPAPSVASPSATAELFSRYSSDVSRPQRLAGHWGLELRGNGSVVVTPPRGYAGVVSGTIFTADRSLLRINLFAQDVCSDLGNGEYAWSRAGDRLVLAVSNDPCEARVRFFSENEWVVNRTTPSGL